MAGRRNIFILAVAAAVIVIIAFAVTSSNDDGSNENDVAANQEEPTATALPADETTTTAQPSSPVEIATRYWQAVVGSDREATLALVDPAAIGSPDVAPWGRADTIEGTFDWYESVGWKWELEGCGEADDGAIECRASARNSWSDAIGVNPVPGIFVVDVSDNGVTAVTDKSELFGSQWSVGVFRVFGEWVTANHPDDAAIMFDFAVDVNDEILSLYAVNTNRFVEADNPRDPGS